MGNKNHQLRQIILKSPLLKQQCQFKRFQQQLRGITWINQFDDGQFRALKVPIREVTKQTIDIYQFRKNNQLYLVPVQGIILSSVKEQSSECDSFEQNTDYFLCRKDGTQDSNQIIVLVSQIKTNLSQVQTRRLSFPEALKILLISAKGLNVLTPIKGTIKPSQNMIMIDMKGRPKLWINSNLASSNIEYSNGKVSSSFYKASDISDPNLQQIHDFRQYSYECVQKLFQIVENKTQNGFPLNFLSEIRKAQTYFEVQNTVGQYCQRNRITLPEIISSLQYQRQYARYFENKPYLQKQAQNKNKASKLQQKGIKKVESVRYDDYSNASQQIRSPHINHKNQFRGYASKSVKNNQSEIKKILHKTSNQKKQRQINSLKKKVFFNRNTLTSNTSMPSFYINQPQTVKDPFSSWPNAIMNQGRSSQFVDFRSKNPNNSFKAVQIWKKPNQAVQVIPIAKIQRKRSETVNQKRTDNQQRDFEQDTKEDKGFNLQSEAKNAKQNFILHYQKGKQENIMQQLKSVQQEIQQNEFIAQGYQKKDSNKSSAISQHSLTGIIGEYLSDKITQQQLKQITKGFSSQNSKRFNHQIPQIMQLAQFEQEQQLYKKQQQKFETNLQQLKIEQQSHSKTGSENQAIANQANQSCQAIIQKTITDKLQLDKKKSDINIQIEQQQQQYQKAPLKQRKIIYDIPHLTIEDNNSSESLETTQMVKQKAISHQMKSISSQQVLKKVSLIQSLKGQDIMSKGHTIIEARIYNIQQTDEEEELVFNRIENLLEKSIHKSQSQATKSKHFDNVQKSENTDSLIKKQMQQLHQFMNFD